MKIITKLAVFAGALGLAAQANATLFDINFASNDGNVTASAQVTATYLGNGLYGATGGLINVSAGDSFTQGTYSLSFNPNAPNQSTSSDGTFYYDNDVIAGNPFLTNPGLLFSTPDGKAIEINLFSNGPSSPVPNGTYQLYESDYNSFGANVLGNATISPTPVPEASTVLAGALMLLPFGVSTIRIIRKRVIA